MGIVTIPTMPRYNDLKAAIVRSGLKQYRVAEHLGYREDTFSSTLSGSVAPKGGATPQEFRQVVKAAIKELQGSKP